eukprot:6177644-Pleurochrysis_carterae.AAC.3
MQGKRRPIPALRVSNLHPAQGLLRLKTASDCTQMSPLLSGQRWPCAALDRCACAYWRGVISSAIGSAHYSIAALATWPMCWTGCPPIGHQLGREAAREL